MDYQSAEPMNRIIICPWFDLGQARHAAEFYARSKSRSEARHDGDDGDAPQRHRHIQTAFNGDNF